MGRHPSSEVESSQKVDVVSTKEVARPITNRATRVTAMVVLLVLVGWGIVDVVIFRAELHAIVGAVRSWYVRPPPRVAESDWYHACEAVVSVIANTVVHPFSVSREELRTLRREVQERDEEPVRARTLEWLVLRLQDTGPRQAETVQRWRPLWEPR